MSNKMFSHWSMSTNINTKQVPSLINPKYYLLDVMCMNKQEWLILEHPYLFSNKKKDEISTKVLWIHDIETDWVDHFLSS